MGVMPQRPLTRADAVALYAASMEAVAKAKLPPEVVELVKLEMGLRAELARLNRKHGKAAVAAVVAASRKGPRTEAMARRVIAAGRRAYKPMNRAALGPIKAALPDLYLAGKAALWARATGKIKTPLKIPLRKLEALDLSTTFTLADRGAIDAMSENLQIWVGKHDDFFLTSDIQDQIKSTVLRDGLSGPELTAKLKEIAEAEVGLGHLPAEGVIMGEAAYWEGMASHVATTARVLGSVSMMSSIGLASGQIVNPNDERTCSRCAQLDGMVFPIEQATAQAKRMTLAGTPEHMKSIQAWRSASEIRDAKAKGGIKALGDIGVTLPPFHYRCRCTIDVTEDASLLPDDLLVEPEKPPTIAPAKPGKKPKGKKPTKSARDKRSGLKPIKARVGKGRFMGELDESISVSASTDAEREAYYRAVAEAFDKRVDAKFVQVSENSSRAERALWRRYHGGVDNGARREAYRLVMNEVLEESGGKVGKAFNNYLRTGKGPGVQEQRRMLAEDLGNMWSRRAKQEYAFEETIRKSPLQVNRLTEEAIAKGERAHFTFKAKGNTPWWEAEYERKNATTFLRKGGSRRVAVHESGHFMEEVAGATSEANKGGRNSPIGQAMRAFLKRRTEGEQLEGLNTISSSYAASEKYKYGAFIDPYVGKHYPQSGLVGRKTLSSTEVFAMGIENQYEATAALRFLAEDPDHFGMILAIRMGRVTL